MCFLSWTCTSCLFSNTLLPLHAFSFPCALLFPFLSHVKSFSLTILLSHAFPPFSLFSSFLDFLLVDASSLWVMLSPSSLLPPSLLLCVLVPLAAFHTSSSFTSLNSMFPSLSYALTAVLDVHVLSFECAFSFSWMHFDSFSCFLSLASMPSLICVCHLSLAHPCPLCCFALLLPPFLALLYKTQCSPLFCLHFLCYSYCQFPVLISSLSLMLLLLIFYYLYLLPLLPFLSFSSSCFPSLSHMLSCFSPSSPHSSPSMLSHFVSL